MKHIILPYFFLTHRIFDFVLSLRDKEKTRGERNSTELPPLTGLHE